MVSFGDWFPHACVGLTFTGLGAMKLYGRIHGVIGGGGMTPELEATARYAGRPFAMTFSISSAKRSISAVVV